MSSIEKFISPFIEQQFPDFYRSEGPNFVAFTKAYYEWLETSGNVLNRSRSLLEYADIDKTEAQFIEYFKRTYIDSIPDIIAADKRLLLKHILDLYRSKGTVRAHELLFRLLFNEDIEVYIPGDFILRPSDGDWYKSEYIETTFHPNLDKLAGRTITNSQQTTTAVVENVYKKIINGESVNVIFLSQIRGIFKYGEKILCNGLITIDDAPIVIGSLTAIPVENGGFGFEVGEILDVVGGGTEGKARVASTRDETGKVVFELLNGGSGYALDAVVTVATTLNLKLENSTGVFVSNTTAVVSNTGANGTVVFANSSYLTLINFSNISNFIIGDSITDGSSNATIVELIGGGGSSATFEVGGIINKELVILNSDDIQDYVATTVETQVEITTGIQSAPFNPGNFIQSIANAVVLDITYLSSNTITVGESLSNTSLGVANLNVYISDDNLVFVTGSDADLTNANLVSGIILTSNTTSSIITIDNVPYKETVTGNAVVFSTNSTSITANIGANHIYFVPGATVLETFTPTTNAIIVSQTSLTDWAFPSRTPTLLTNLESPLDETLVLTVKEIGTISFLTNINPGEGYSSPPYITVIQPDIVKLNESDGFGGIKGDNAIVNGRVSSEQGVVTAVEVYSSGFGYVPNETLFLRKRGTSEGISIRGVAVVENDGRGEGSWRGNKSFISDIIKIQDSDYYQIYSYELVANRMLDTYKTLVTDLVHPSGYKLFGRYRSTVNLITDEPTLESSTITQS
jgi:hypothetical protein